MANWTIGEADRFQLFSFLGVFADDDGADGG
jgi:hypothetical protein